MFKGKSMEEKFIFRTRSEKEYTAIRNKFRNKKGQWEWHTWVYDTPQPPSILPKRGDGVTILPKTVHGSAAHGLGSNIVSTELTKNESQNTEKEKNIYPNNKIQQFYENKIGKMKARELIEFQEWRNNYPENLIMLAIERSVEYNKKSFGYINTILVNWEKNGRNGAKRTPDKIDYLQDEFAEFIEE